MDDCAGKGFEMLISACGHLILPSLRLLLQVLLNSLRFVVLAVALPCRNCAVCVLQSCSLMKSVSLGSGRGLGVGEKCRPLLVSGVAGGSPGSTGVIQVLSCSVTFGC